MKKIVLMITAAAMSTAAFSQVSIDPEVGMNISNIRTKVGDNDATSNDGKVGLSIGAGVKFDISNGFYVKPGLYYHMLGDKHEVGEITTTVNYDYLRLPVNLGYEYGFGANAGSLFVEAGPYVGYALAGKTSVESPLGDVDTDITFGDDITETKPVDFGVNFNLGYVTPWGVYVKGGYGLGLSNMSNVNDLKATHNNFNIGIGYRIKL